MHSLRFFGTSGIRGLIDVNLTPDFTLKISMAFASLIGGGSVAVGFDVRSSSQAIRYAVISGLLSSGVNVIDCGLTPTPALLYTVKELKLDGAVMVTGSHTPPSITGLLFFLGDTSELTFNEALRLEEYFLNGKFRRASWSSIGRVETVDSLSIYVENVLRSVNVKAVSSLNAKVVFDAGNSAQSLVARRVLEGMGCTVEVINDRINGFFSSRPPYPTPESLHELSKKVTKVKAELGVATDGDGDRGVFCDESGVVYWGDVTGCIFSKHELIKNNGGAIVCPVNTSNLIKYICRRYKGILVYTGVGPPSIIRGIKDRGDVVFAFEETGKYIWPNVILYGDPLLATGKLLEIISLNGSLAEITSKFPKYYRVKAALQCPDNLKRKYLDEILKLVKFRFPSAKLNFTDGVKVEFNDDWILFRPSGTEPSFRIYVESPSRDKLSKLYNEGIEIFNTVSSIVKS